MSSQVSPLYRFKNAYLAHIIVKNYQGMRFFLSSSRNSTSLFFLFFFVLILVWGRSVRCFISFPVYCRVVQYIYQVRFYL